MNTHETRVTPFRLPSVVDFPKIKSPFMRKEINGKYVVTPQIEPGYEWVFEDEGVLAVDKLHGTNVCCIFDDGRLIAIDNRATRIMERPSIFTELSAIQACMIKGVLSAIERGWIDKKFTGRLYGELVGPTINENIHCVSTYYFVPFPYLKKKCFWKAWLSNKYPKTFESISGWFKPLNSIFTKRIRNESARAEGLVFHHPDGKRMAKLRRDMFDWYGEIK